MSERVAVVVLGRRGLTRDVVTHLLETSSYDTVNVAAAERPDGTIVAVLVEPSADDWAMAESLDAGVVVVDGDLDDNRLIDHVTRGALAVLDMETELPEILDAIDAVFAGEAILRHDQARVVLDRLRVELHPVSDRPRLTKREAEILASIERGESVKQTARVLEISEKTVQNLQSRLFRKVGARNRAQAVARAHELGLLPHLVGD